MNFFKKVGIFLFIAVLLVSFAPYEKVSFQKKTPFTIIEKSYFYWVGGKKGTNGFKIQIVGTFNTTNLDFNTIYFHNRELKVVPNIHLDKFTLVGGYTTFNDENILADDIQLNDDNSKENSSDDIPFELEKDEAVLVYSISGRKHYYKIKDIEQKETIYYP